MGFKDTKAETEFDLCFKKALRACENKRLSENKRNSIQ